MIFAEPLTDVEIERIGDGGLVLRDHWLGDALATACAEALRGRTFRAAGIGRGGDHRHDDTLRGDAIEWLDPSNPGPFAPLNEAFQELRRELSAALRLGLPDTELQIARYPGGGARYVRHRDAFARLPGRRITAIWYANPDWIPEHGGQLRAYPPSGPVDIDPLLDRLLLFASDRLEHEVLPCHAPRFAVTAWLGVRTLTG